MKRILFLLPVLLSVSMYAQNKTLKQKIEKRFNSSGILTFQIIEDFDNNGFRIKRSVLGSSGELKSYRAYNNDSIERVVADTGFNNKSEIIDIWSYKYDENNEVIRQTRIYPQRGDTYVEIYSITYDSSTNIIEKKQFDKDSTLDWVYNYEFNEENLEIRFTSKFQGTIRNERTYKYKNGLKVEEILYDYENEELRQRKNTLYFLKYDKSRKLVRKIVHSVAEHLEKKIITKYMYTYDNYGNVTLEERKKDGKRDSKKKFEYKYW